MNQFTGKTQDDNVTYITMVKLDCVDRRNVSAKHRLFGMSEVGKRFLVRMSLWGDRRTEEGTLNESNENERRGQRSGGDN